VFTGIVREVGRVEAVEERGESVRLVVRAPETAAAAAVGDSVSLAGVCLTAVEVADGTVAFDAVPETLRRSTLGRLETGGGVNVEPALRAGDPLGGHIVQGHVDGVGRIRRVDDEGIEVEASQDVLRYCVEKGSITVEGVSLTIAGLGESSFTVALIPHTRDVTTLGGVAEGDDVNLEVDVVAKYVERLALPHLAAARAGSAHNGRTSEEAS
jgi:riboflavin synthase